MLNCRNVFRASTLQISIMAGELEKLLRQFAARWGLQVPRTDDQGYYFFVLDGCLRITLFQIGHQIYLEGRPGALPTDPRQAEDRLGEILCKHLAALEKQEETLSLDPASDDLLLFRCLPVRTLSLDDLEKAIEAFANRLEFWGRVLLGGPAPLAPPTLHFVFP